MQSNTYQIALRLSLFFFMFFSIQSHCQSENIRFESLKHGLSNQYIRCILKDSKGYMWFGTQNGLTRYDGVNFFVYENDPEDSTSICYNNIGCLYEASDGRLWVGTFKGLSVYNHEKNNFKKISPIHNDCISAISEDKDQTIWIGTVGTGILKYDVLTNTVDTFSNTQTNLEGINQNHITNLLIDNKNRIWVGSWNGLLLMNNEGTILKHFKNEPNNVGSLSDNYINTLTIDNDNNLWIGTLGGYLNKINLNDDEFQIHQFQFNGKSNWASILNLFTDDYTNLWIAVEGKGLLQMNTETGTIKQFTNEKGNPYSLNSNYIRSIYRDDLDILWIGTLGHGVNVLDRRNKQFNSYKSNPYSKNSICDDEVRCFAEDKYGKVWIGTYNGISAFDPAKNQFTQVLSQESGDLTTNAVTSMVFDKDDNLWIGTLDKGIDCFDKNLNKIGNFKIRGHRKGVENKINILYVDSQNNLWVGTSGSGLFLYNRSKNAFSAVYDESKGFDESSMGYVFSILETSDKNLWVGTAYQLYCLIDSGKNKTIKVYGSTDAEGSIQSNYITSLFEDSEGKLWIGSLDRGLSVYNKSDDSFAPVTVKDGLSSNSIFGILEDDKNNLWLSTNKGISKYNTEAGTFTNYTRQDGLISDEFNRNSCYRSKDGSFYFGSNEGFNYFNPANININTVAQPVHLTDFKIFNETVPIGKEGSPLAKRIDETREITLKHNQSSFTINFVALNYITGSKSQYKYILEGLEERWNLAENINSASYSYIKPGKYTFKVKGSNNDGVWHNDPAELEIVVLPPFWKSRWAYLIYFLIIAVIIYAIIHYRVTRAKEIHMAEIVHMKLQFFANISHEFRTPLSLILSPIENMLSNSVKDKTIKSQLEIIHKNANRLFRLVDEIMDFHRAEESKLSIHVKNDDIVKYTRELSSYFQDEASRRQISFSFKSQLASIEAWFDSEKYEKMILNLLSNAFKFTHDRGAIAVNIEKLGTAEIQKIDKSKLPKATSKELLKITVTDNGIGIESADINQVFDRFYQKYGDDYRHQSGIGIGLSLTKTLVEMHHGSIYVTSTKDEETCFTILLPLGKNHFKKSEILDERDESEKKIVGALVLGDRTQKERAKNTKNAPSILLVDDNYDFRKYVASVLAKNYKIIEADTSEVACKLAEEHVPDLVISDIIMPVLSGIELCKLLKENILTSHIPVILLTAKSSMEDRIFGVKTGADAYITKPFNIRYLEVVINNLIDTRKVIFQRFSQEVYIMPKEITNNQLDQDFLKKVINYIEDNVNKPELSVEDLASYLLMSKGHTWRKVKSLTGLTTNEFIRTIKLKKAVKIMEEDNFNISEIAYKVGFSSPAYFTKCFKKQYGKSPSAFLNGKRKVEG